MPRLIRAGTTVQYTRSLTDYPASAWGLAVAIRGTQTANAGVTTSGDLFVVTFSPTATGALKPGTFRYVERVTSLSDATQVFDVADPSGLGGTIQVLADVVAAAAGDLQIFEEKLLAVIESVLLGRVTDDLESYTIGGRSVLHIPEKELWERREKLLVKIAAIRNPNKFGQDVTVTFCGPPLRP